MILMAYIWWRILFLFNANPEIKLNLQDIYNCTYRMTEIPIFGCQFEDA